MPTVEKLIRTHHCPICEKKLGDSKCFIIGPMMALTRIAVDPPAHPDCAKAHADKFKTPGVVVLWFTSIFSLFPTGKRTRAFRLGQPDALAWQKNGRQATREEVKKAISDALPMLEESCCGDEDLIRLEHEHNQLLTLVDATTAP